MTNNWIRTALVIIAAAVVLLVTFTAFRPKTLYRGQVAVLMYHHVHDTDQSPGTITTKLFSDQLSYLKDKGYHFIRLDDLRRFLQGGTVPDNAVLVTFDDGYESFYLNAYPVLQKLDIPAVNFVITGDLDHPKDTLIPSMSRDEIRKMTGESNLIDIGCHSNALHDKTASGEALLTGRLPGETDEAYRKRISADTGLCVSRVKELTNGPADSMAYPFGIFNGIAASLIHEQGINYAFTILPKMTTPDTDPMRIPRINAGAPNITPVYLHNIIMHRVVPVDPKAKDVVLRDTLEQIGAELAVDPADGGLLISYNGDQWKARSGSKDVLHTRGDGGHLQLKQPIRTVGNRTYIALDDLETILGVPIRFDPVTETYTASLPARSDVDTESGRHAPAPAK